MSGHPNESFTVTYEKTEKVTNNHKDPYSKVTDLKTDRSQNHTLD